MKSNSNVSFILNEKLQKSRLTLSRWRVLKPLRKVMQIIIDHFSLIICYCLNPITAKRSNHYSNFSSDINVIAKRESISFNCKTLNNCLQIILWNVIDFNFNLSNCYKFRNRQKWKLWIVGILCLTALTR